MSTPACKLLKKLRKRNASKSEILLSSEREHDVKFPAFISPQREFTYNVSIQQMQIM